MRIAIDCRYIRERPSGIGTYVEALVDALPALAPSDHFNLWAHRLAPRPLSSAPNVFETRVTPEPNSLRTVLWPDRYADLDGIDLFHGAHNILPRRIHCPSVITIHDVLPLERPELAFVRWRQRAKRIYYVQAVWRALRQATRLIVTTSAMADRLRRIEPETIGRTDVVPLGVSDSFRPPLDRRQTRARVAQMLGFNEPYVLVVGQNSPNKRHELALAAFAAHVPPPWHLVFVQRQTTSSPFWYKAIALGVSDRVQWLPDVTKQDLIQLYQGADALVQPSCYEGFALPTLEAMACGCPVVATDLDVFREIMGTAALLVGDDNVHGFGRALVALLKSPSWRGELSEAGISQARGYSWNRCAEKTLDVFYYAAGMRRPVEHDLRTRRQNLQPQAA